MKKPAPSPAPAAGGSGFEEVAPLSFLSMTESAAKSRYERVWREVREGGSIVIDVSRKEETKENRVMVGFPRGTINHFQANISRVMARNGIEVTRTLAREPAKLEEEGYLSKPHTSSGRVGAVPIEVMQAAFVSHLSAARVSLPLEERRSPLAGKPVHTLPTPGKASA